jgi:excisionase family DNA binding protein
VAEQRETFLKVSEVARRLRVSRPTIYRRISEGQLPAIRVGNDSGPLRVPERELDAWLYGPAGGIPPLSVGREAAAEKPARPIPGRAPVAEEES